MSENVLANNSWELTGYTTSATDFISIAEEQAKAPREADGGLPRNGFCKLTSSSGLIDKGTTVSYSWESKTVDIPFTGTAPDPGAYEFGEIPIKIGSFAESKNGGAGFYCSPSIAVDLTTLFFSMEKKGNVKISLYTAEGKLVRRIADQSYPQGGNFYVCPVTGLASGNYFFAINQENSEKIIKFVKS